MQFIQFYRCTCGAITFVADDGREFSVMEADLDKYLPRKRLDALCKGGDFSMLKELDKTFACNHCVNHYGLDLCACGSGMAPEKCDQGFDVCGKPMQSIEDGYVSVRASDCVLPANKFAVKVADLRCRGKEHHNNDSANSYVVSWKKAIEAQMQSKKLIASALEDIIKRIRSCVMDGVTVSNTKVLHGTVKLSTICKNESIMSPDYYFAETQAEIVERALKRYIESTKLLGFRETIEEMVEKKSVRINQTSYRLNPETLGVLKDFLDKTAVVA